MASSKSILLLGVGALALAGCESLPALPSLPSASPSGIFQGVSSAPCPDFAPGPVDFEPPFPAKCDEMQLSASGLRWIPVTVGETERGQPGPDATVVVNYEGFLADTGLKIDSSYSRGESSVYTVPELLEGWGEVIQKMSPGDEWLIFIPSELAFGDEAVGELIPPDADVVFQVELEGFLSAAELAAAAGETAVSQGPDMAAWQAYLPWNPDSPDVTVTDSGLSFVILERGDPDRENPTRDDRVLVHYEGRLADTTEFFDSSWSVGEPAEFDVGALIPGFSEALTLMRPGDRYLVHIPAELAYGESGAGDVIPANADLVFQINLLAIKTD